MSALVSEPSHLSSWSHQRTNMLSPDRCWRPGTAPVVEFELLLWAGWGSFNKGAVTTEKRGSRGTSIYDEKSTSRASPETQKLFPVGPSPLANFLSVPEVVAFQADNSNYNVKPETGVSGRMYSNDTVCLPSLDIHTLRIFLICTNKNIVK